MLVPSKHSKQEGSHGGQIWFVVSSQYPLGQESRHIVDDGCRKYSDLQAEHSSWLPSSQTEQATLQGMHLLFVSSSQCPAGQLLRQVVDDGCRKYPDLQAIHLLFPVPVQPEQEISHCTQVLVVESPPYPVGQESRQVVDDGWRKYPKLQAEH